MASETEKNLLNDVAKPGSTPPDTSSKPVIVSHKPMMKDPMVNEEAVGSDESEEKSETVIRKASKNNTVQPIHPDTKDETTTNEAKTNDDTSDDKKSDEALDAQISEDTTKNNKKKSKQDDDQQAEKIAKLVESKKYFVKVRAPRRKRNKRLVFTLLLIVILSFVGFAALADAEIIDVPVPFDFIKKTQPEVTVAVIPHAEPKKETTDSTAKAETQVTPEGYLVYKNEDIGFKFAYPKEWGTAVLKSDPATSETFLLSFEQPQIGDAKSKTVIELRGQKKNVSNAGGDSRYTKGFILKDGKYYYRSKDEATDDIYVINEVDILSKVINGFGTSLVVDYVGLASYHELDGVINIDNKDWPGLVLSYVNGALLEKDGTAGKSYSAADQKTMEKVVATFSKL